MPALTGGGVVLVGVGVGVGVEVADGVDVAEGVALAVVVGLVVGVVVVCADGAEVGFFFTGVFTGFVVGCVVTEEAGLVTEGEVADVEGEAGVLTGVVV